ncbi:MAG TPA: AraC family transcriptional regulator [Pyrinomonadaceae bacterium]|nr:AraC family transcriptional regulator [Pyrinomonadaceae bacterium]
MGNTYRVRFFGTPLADDQIASVHAMEKEVGNFYLTECNYPPNLQVPSHAHENPSFYLVTAGMIAEEHGRMRRDCRVANLVFTPPGEPHSNSTNESGGRCFMVDMKSEWLAAIDVAALKLNEWAHFGGGQPVCLAQRAFRESLNLDSISSIMIEGLMLELLAEVSRRRIRFDALSPRWLEDVREILHSRFAEKLTINEIAHLVARHPVHLATQFRRSFKCTIGDYLRELRIETACRRLAGSDDSLTQIAFDCGFADQSHFCRAFKAALGVTASEYRRSFAQLKPRQNPFSETSN